MSFPAPFEFNVFSSISRIGVSRFVYFSRIVIFKFLFLHPLSSMHFPIYYFQTWCFPVFYFSRIVFFKCLFLHPLSLMCFFSILFPELVFPGFSIFPELYFSIFCPAPFDLETCFHDFISRVDVSRYLYFSRNVFFQCIMFFQMFFPELVFPGIPILQDVCFSNLFSCALWFRGVFHDVFCQNWSRIVFFQFLFLHPLNFMFFPECHKLYLSNFFSCTLWSLCWFQDVFSRSVSWFFIKNWIF